MPKIEKGKREYDTTYYLNGEQGNIDIKQGSGNTKDQHFFLEKWGDICNNNNNDNMNYLMLVFT